MVDRWMGIGIVAYRTDAIPQLRIEVIVLGVKALVCYLRNVGAPDREWLQVDWLNQLIYEISLLCGRYPTG